MADSANRYVKVGNWIFEVKMVRAIRVEEYGKPYEAVAHVAFNGSDAFIDSYLSKNDNPFERSDFNTFLEFSKLMGAENFRYDRFHNGQRMSKNIKLLEKHEVQPNIRLVK
ncbi:hypothetical protein GCM10009092_41150 [Bowmanella denitrificans]|uniref:Uncharacterized protein n=2 Tax=Bowmanella denitrificans TaxID=366582 RepID=A0ABP3HK70_9ALTE